MEGMLMKCKLLPLAFLAAALTAQSTGGMAQTDVTVPGGANGANVYCLQAGDLNSGAFVGTFLQTGSNTWEERLKAGSFKLDERKRDDLMVELFDSSRSAKIQFDFVNRTIKYSPANATDGGRDRYYILSAVDKANSEDCAATASLNEAGGAGSGGGGPSAGGAGPGGGGSGPGGGRPGAGGAGGGGGAGGQPSGPGNRPMDVAGFPPRILLVVPPGTQFTPVSGPPCPGNPGLFLCPNKFTCVAPGGVCCPGVGACNPGFFCDRFVRGNCVGPGNPRFCNGSQNPRTGIALHCPVGKTCIAGNLCQ
jgi:hypothetical protein